MILKLVAIPILFFLPGFFFLRIFTRERSVALVLFAVLFSLPATSACGYLLASLQSFSLPALLLSNLLICAVLFFLRTTPSFRLESAFDSRYCLALIALTAALFAYYHPPSEYYFGGRDPGIYVVNGIRIAETGSFHAPDPLLQEVDEKYWTLFFDRKGPIRYMGFLADRDSAEITPIFFYLYPVWFAVFYLLFGVHGMLYATPFLACASLAGIALFAREMIGKLESLAVLLLLGCSAIYLWFARFPNSEFAAACFLFAGVLGFELYRKHSVSAFGWMGAVCLGLAFWARVDAVLVGVSFTLFLAMRWMDGTFRRKELWFLAAYLVFLAVAFAQSLSTSDYIPAVINNLRFKPVRVAATGAAAALITGAIVYTIRKRQWLQSPRSGRGFSAVLALLLAYAYFVRPHYPLSNIGSPNAEAFVALGWYFTDPVVLLSVAGIVLYAARFRSIHWIFLSAVLFFGVLYFYRIRGHAEHFWMLRRYLPVICPAVALFAVYAAGHIPRLNPARRSVLILVLAAGLSAGYLYSNRALHRHHEFQNSFAFIRSFADRMNPDDLLLISPKEANDLHVIGPMLSYYFHRNVLLLRTSTPNLELLAEFLSRRKGRIFFAGAGNANLATGRFSLEPLEEIRFETPTYDELYHQRPNTALSKYFQIGWYRIRFAPPSEPDFVDVGRFDDGSISGFFLKESYAGITYRWTNGKGHVYFPPNPGNTTGIVLQLNPGPWVPGMERVRAKIYANETLLVDLILRNGYNTYEVPVPPALQEKLAGVPIDIRIESKTWVPKRVLNLPDTRRVGVIVDWVRLTGR